MPPSLQVTFRNLLPSEQVIALVREHALQLSDRHECLIGCHAIVAAEQGEQCRVALELAVRARCSITAAHGTGLSSIGEPDVAVVRAFARARVGLEREAGGSTRRS